MSTLLSVAGSLGDLVAAVPGAVTALPDPEPQAPPGTEGFVSIMSWARWVALAICILGLVAAGAMMAIQSRRGEGGEHIGKIGMALGGVIVISAAGALVGFLAT